MVAANVKIIEDLQAFIALTSEDAGVRRHFTSSPSDFTRKRLLPLQRVVQLIVGLLKRSLSVELQEFFSSVVKTSQTCTKGAFSQQRQKLKASFFEFMNHLLVSSFYEHYRGAEQRWRGFLLLACDGSTVYLPCKPTLREHFGVQVNQHSETVMARVVQVEDVLNHLVVREGIYPITTSEQQVVYSLADHYPADSLVLLDRNFATYTLMYLLQNQETPVPFVIRCKTRGLKVVKEFLASGASSRVVPWYASPKVCRQLHEQGYVVEQGHALGVRMVGVPLPGGEQEVLLTNLYDEHRYTAEDLKQLYALRWGVETTFGCQKNPLQLEEFSGLTVRAIEQDYMANVLVQNLQRLVEKQCTAYLSLVNTQRQHGYQVNRSVSFAALKRAVAPLLEQKQVVWILLRLQRTFEQYLEPLRPGRNYLRMVKTKRRKGRFHTYTNFKRAI